MSDTETPRVGLDALPVAVDHPARDVGVIGVVDGTQDCTTTTFWVVTDRDASVELDDR